MSYEELSLEGFISEVKNASRGIHSRKFCFVLGAGASITSGLTSGQELVDIWERELIERNKAEHIKWKEKLKINEDNKYSFYSQYYERRYRRTPIDGYNYLEKLMESAKPSIGYVILAFIMAKTEHNIVLTTNFDHLTEDALTYYTNATPLIIGHESLAAYISARTKRPTVIKIHRDLLFDPKSKTSELAVLHENWKKYLGYIFAEYSPVFIGYAGNDNSLMNYLDENAEKFKSGEWNCPYWLNYKNAPPCDKVKKFLDAADGYLIPHYGFDETMFLLGSVFDYKLPEESEFLDDAKKRYEALKTADENYRNNLTQKDISQNDKQENDEEDLYTKALISTLDGNFDDAINLQKKLIASDPNNAYYYSGLSFIYHKMGNYEQAAVESRKAIVLEPDNAVYYDGLSADLYAAGKDDEALIESKKAIELAPNVPDYHHHLGLVLKALKKYEEAETSFLKAIELDQTNAEYHFALGITLHELKRYEEAVAEKSQAISINSNDANYHHSLGVSLHELKRYDEAVAEKKQAIEIDPDNAEYHNSLAVTLHIMKRYNDALTEETKAIEIDPNNAKYNHNLGVTLHELKRFEEAETAKRRALEINPNDAKYHYSLGLTLDSMEKYEEAIAEKEIAIKLEPENEKFSKSLNFTQSKIKPKDNTSNNNSTPSDLDPNVA